MSNAGREGKPDHAANHAKQGRFDQELQQNLFARSAEGLSQADLKGPFGHGNKHDIHHDYSADDQNDHRNRHDDSRDRPGNPAVAQLQAEGCTVRILSADVAKEADVEGVLGLIADSGLPLRGVIHAAGVLDDGLIEVALSRQG